MANGTGKDRRLRLLGPMVPGSGATHCASWSGDFILSNRHRLASIGKKGIRRRPIFCLGDDPAQPRHCEWLLCRSRESRRPRSACGRRRNRVLGTKLCCGAEWRNHCQRFGRSRRDRDCRRGMGSRERTSDALAIFARPTRRCLLGNRATAARFIVSSCPEAP